MVLPPDIAFAPPSTRLRAVHPLRLPFGRWLRAILCLAALALSLALAQAAGDTLDWRLKENTVDAQIDNWPLQQLLETVAAKTGWQIYVEPDTEHRVSAKFKNAKPGEALRRLLGDLSYALVPADKGPARLYIFRNSQAQATQLVAAPRETTEGRSHALGKELIVTLKPDSKTSIDDLAKQLGARVVGRIDKLHAYRLQFDSEEAAASARQSLASNSDVSSTESNVSIDRPQVPAALPGTGALPFNLRPRSVSDSSQVTIGLIDTAVQTEGTVLKDFLLKGISVAGETTPPSGQLTHGSAMAETMLYALAKAPDAAQGTPVRILPVDVYGGAENTTTFQVTQGIVEAINAGAPIINLSLGGTTDSALLRSVIEAGTQQGIIFVAAAGNEPVTTPTYPAAYPGVIAVTALTRDGQIASYANRGDFVNAAAPGTSVVPYDGQSYVIVGTSTSAANASAYASALMSSSGKSGTDLAALIRQALGVKTTGGKH